MQGPCGVQAARSTASGGRAVGCARSGRGRGSGGEAAV